MATAPPPPTRQRQAYLFAGMTVLCWSTVASAFKVALRHLPVPTLLFYASLTATLVLAGSVAAQGKLRLLRAHRPVDWLRSAGLGLLNPFLYYVVLFEAYDRLPAQEAQPLNCIWPLVLALLSVPVLGQKLTWRQVAGLLVSLAGVVVVSTKGDVLGLHFSNLPGALLAVGSALIWACFWLGNMRDAHDETLKLFLGFAVGLVPIAVLAATTTGFRLESPAGLGGAVYIGLFEMGVTFQLWLRALTLSDNVAKVSRLIYLAPFISLFWIRLLVGETILPSTVGGLVLIVAGIVLGQGSDE